MCQKTQSVGFDKPFVTTDGINASELKAVPAPTETTTNQLSTAHDYTPWDASIISSFRVIEFLYPRDV